MNLEEEVGVLKICTPEREAHLVLPKPVEGNIIRPPFYGYLFGNNGEGREISSPLQTLEMSEHNGETVLVVATRTIERVRELLETKTHELKGDNLESFKGAVEEFDDPEMKVHVIPGLQLKVVKIREESFMGMLKNARKRA
jgi:hypothetical protein